MNPYKIQIKKLHLELGIPDNYEKIYGLTLQKEATEFIEISHKNSEQKHLLTPQTANKWFEMKEASAKEKIQLIAVSAFRSLTYQANLIKKKIAEGAKIEDVLTVIAAPGYSEHHTGNAIDIGTPESEALEEDFENTDAFSWLAEHAIEFGFSLSYPKNSPNKIIYEPWHWAFLEN